MPNDGFLLQISHTEAMTIPSKTGANTQTSPKTTRTAESEIIHLRAVNPTSSARSDDPYVLVGVGWRSAAFGGSVRRRRMLAGRISRAMSATDTPAPSTTVPAALGPLDLVAWITAFRDGLRTNQAAMNRLNVYPVPDGDTGTNMALTIEAVVAELASTATAGPPSMASVCQAIAHGSLMGARGNSGVILCQILRGLSTECRAHEAVDGVVLAAALTAASAGAYGAVMKPIEGTILTVARGAAEAAAEVAGPSTSLLDVAEAARRGAADALAQTPDMLPVLKAAGVVDSGGTGYLVLLDALLHHLDGRAIPTVEAPGSALPPDPLADDASNHHVGHGSSGSGERTAGVEELRYEVMYFLEAPDASIGGFKDAWAAIGDSIVVVGGEGLWNCHIHTDDVGAAIEVALDIGRPRKIRVTDLHEEVEEERWVREATGASIVDEPPHVNDPCETAIVVVASGEGNRRLFLSLGVQRVVTGGQSMNPSTAQLLEAVEACPATSVVILPNNKNIIPVAEQISALTKKSVRVIGTRGVTDGLAAAMQYDPQGNIEDNTASMRTAAANVVSGEITVAVRDSTSDAGPIFEGDHLGLTRVGGIVVVQRELSDACTGLLSAIVGDGHEIVTVIEGEGASSGVTRTITEWLADNRPGVVAEVHHGGQPLYPYLFGVE